MDYIHYLRETALTWDAMLNMTKTNFELNPEPVMHILFEKSMRVSNISNTAKPAILFKVF